MNFDSRLTDTSVVAVPSKVKTRSIRWGLIGGCLLVAPLFSGFAHAGWPFGAKKLAPYSLVLDSKIADAISLTCSRNTEQSLECIISNKMRIRASLSPLEFVCFKGDVMVHSVNMYDEIDANGKLKYNLYCFNDFDRAVLRQRGRAY